MNRIKELFATDSKKLIVFITAGFPNKDSTKDLVLEAIKGGADMIEIGIPSVSYTHLRAHETP